MSIAAAQNVIFILFSSLFSLFVVPLVYFCFLPFILWRLIVQFCAYLIYKDKFYRIVSPFSTFVGVNGLSDNFYNSCNICISFKIQHQNIEFEELKRLILSKIIWNSREDGEIKYPELQQFVTVWAGFPFWEWDKKFSIENHVLEFDNNDGHIDEVGVWNLEKHLLEENFSMKQSPWKFILVKNVSDSKSDFRNSFILFKFHHVLGDGFSLMRVLYELNDSSGSPLRFKIPKMSKKELLIQTLKLLFLAPLGLVLTFRRMGKYGKNLKLAQCSEKRSIGLSEPIPRLDSKIIQFGKKIKFSTITVLAASKAIEHFLISTKRNGDKNQMDFVPCYTCLPNFSSIARPGKCYLENNFYVLFYLIPIGRPASEKVENKLNLIEQEFKRGNKNLFPVVFNIWLRLIGSLPLKFQKFLSFQLPFSQVTGLPLPHNLSIFKNPVLEQHYSINFAYNSAMNLVVADSNGQFRFVLSIDQNLVPSNTECEKLVKLIELEFYKIFNKINSISDNDYI